MITSPTRIRWHFMEWHSLEHLADGKQPRIHRYCRRGMISQTAPKLPTPKTSPSFCRGKSPKRVPHPHLCTHSQHLTVSYLDDVCAMGVMSQLPPAFISGSDSAGESLVLSVAKQKRSQIISRSGSPSFPCSASDFQNGSLEWFNKEPCPYPSDHWPVCSQTAWIACQRPTRCHGDPGRNNLNMLVTCVSGLISNPRERVKL